MKGGKTPVHIMRVAPADYVNDPWVKLALKRGQYDLLTFFHLFLYHCHIQGGSLPAQEEQLAAVLGLKESVVRRGISYWSAPECGLVVVRSGLAWNPRVARDVAKAIEFIDGQSEHGRHGGRGNKKGYPKATLSDDESQPLAVAVSHKPEPLAVASAVAVDPSVRRLDIETSDALWRARLEEQRELLRTVGEIAERSGRDPPAVMREVTAYRRKDGVTVPGRINPADLTPERVTKSLEDAKAHLASLERKREAERA